MNDELTREDWIASIIITTPFAALVFGMLCYAVFHKDPLILLQNGVTCELSSREHCGGKAINCSNGKAYECVHDFEILKEVRNDRRKK